MKKYSFIVVIMFFLVLTSSKEIIRSQQNEEELIGTWIMVNPEKIGEADELLTTKWVFSSGNECRWLENGIKVYTFDYSVSNYSCDNTYDSKYKTLKLVDNISQKNLCYGINGFSEFNGKTYLSIEFEGNPDPMVFVKFTFQNPHELPEDIN